MQFSTCGIPKSAKHRRWWASGDRSVDRGCPWTNSQFQSAQSICWSMQWHRQSRIQPFSQLHSHFLNSHFRSAIAFVFSVSFLSFICYQFSSLFFYSSSFFHWVSLPLSIVFRVQGSRVQVISERSSDKWKVKWYLVIRSPRGVITERWLAEGEKEPRPELQIAIHGRTGKSKPDPSRLKAGKLKPVPSRSSFFRKKFISIGWPWHGPLIWSFPWKYRL